MAKIQCVSAPWHAGINVLISDGEYVVKAIRMERREQGEVIEPTFRLTTQEGQELFDNLWQCGFRPEDGTGSAGQLEATERHLEDMRRLVFEVNKNA